MHDLQVLAGGHNAQYDIRRARGYPWATPSYDTNVPSRHFSTPKNTYMCCQSLILMRMIPKIGRKRRDAMKHRHVQRCG